MRHLNSSFLLPLLVLAGCDGSPITELDAGASDASSPGECPSPELPCELDGPADLSVGSLFAMALADLAPTADVDSIGLRIDGDVRATNGTPCARARDVPACMAALEALPEAEWAGGFVNACALPSICEADLVVTRGDEAFVVDSVEGMLEVFGTIDAPIEAALIAFATRPPGGPAYAGYEVTAVARSGDGFDLLGRYVRSDCDPIVSRHVRLRVGADGTVSVACDRVASCTAGACI